MEKKKVEYFMMLALWEHNFGGFWSIVTYLPLKTRLAAPLKVHENGKEALRLTPRSANGMVRLVPG